MDFEKINNNIISNRWKARYDEQPEKIRQKLDKLNNASIAEYQLQVIKRKRIYPQIGDVFLVNPKDDIYFWGIVINNHINNLNGDDLLVIMVFNERVTPSEKKVFIPNYDNLLIPPQVVGQEYWTRGYFYNIDHLEEIGSDIDYGFYDIFDQKYMDEYERELANEPKLLGTGGVATISGVARKINKELIIAGIL